MNLTEAVDIAVQEPSLEKALSWICVCENDRAVHQALRNYGVEPSNRDRYMCHNKGAMWDTCFELCIKAVMKKWNETENIEY